MPWENNLKSILSLSICITIDMIEQLRKYREKGTDMDTNFLLAHNLYGKATIPPTDKVRRSLCPCPDNLAD